jgi:gluconate 2-dehydrogenase gamma chain
MTTRRDLVLGSLGLAAFVAEAQQHPLEVLDPATAADVEALTAQIIPSEAGSPGAREAGVIHFIDRALATFESAQREAYRKGMEEIQHTRHKLFPESTSIAGLTVEQQIGLLRAIEKTEFFELLRKHTIWGFVGSPIYGGNRGEVGWAHIGFDDRMHFEPPFGYYDAEVRRSGKP